MKNRLSAWVACFFIALYGLIKSITAIPELSCILHGNMYAITLQLKDYTTHSRQLLEEKMYHSIRAIKTVRAYGNLLRLFYSFFAPLEREVNKFLDKGNLFNISTRNKALLLRTDLLHHHGHLPDLAEKSDLPQLKNKLQALGALYVMESATMDGAVIIKIIAGQLQTAVPGTLFFEGYKEDTLMMWNGFKDVLDEQVVSAEDQLVVIEAANQTFTRFAKWLDDFKRAVTA